MSPACLLFSWFPRPLYLLAIRLEHSDEIAGEPAWQYGVSVSWRVHRNINLLAGYLYGDYQSDFVEDDRENELRHRNLSAARLTIEFRL